MLQHEGVSRNSIAGARAVLHDQGFVALDGIFSVEQVAEVENMLDGLWAELASSPRAGRHNRFVGDMAPRLDDNITSEPGAPPRQPELRYAACLAPALLRTGLFRTCAQLARMLGGNISRSFDHAIYKPANNAVSTAWHQDHAYFRVKLAPLPSRLNFWIPLQDTTPDNGCMMYAPGTHRTRLKHHAFPRQTGREGLAAAPIDVENVVACPVPLGGLTIHTPLALHAAGPNRTDKPRKAWIIQFSPFGAAQIRLRQLLGHAPRGLI